MKDMKDLFKQLTDVQTKMHDIQNDLVKQKVEGESGGGLVKVGMNGRHDVYKVSIDESLLDDREMLEDLIAGAINDAVRRVDQLNQDKLTSMAGKIDFPLPK